MKTGLRTKRKLIVLVLLSILALLGNAQSNLVFYHTNDQFNSSNFNPAFLTSQQKFTFSIFPLSGMSVGYNNQQVVKDMLTSFLSGGIDKDNLTIVFKSLLKHDLFYQRFESSLLNFGYNSTIGSFDFRIKEVEQLRTGFKGPFSEFLTSTASQTIILNQAQLFPADAVHYREYSLGYAKEIIKNKLSVGLRAKIYFGKASAVSEVQGEVILKNGSYILETFGPIKTSIPMDMSIGKDSILYGANLPQNFSASTYLTNSKNIGAGIDLGFNYKINSRIVLSASITDFGKINWNNNLKTINYMGKYKLPGKYIANAGSNFLTKTSAFNLDDVNVYELFKSTLDSNKYSTHLPTTFYVGLQYQINPALNIGLVDRFINSKGMNHNSFSLTANYDLNKKLTISTGYSTIGKAYNNIPFAILYNWGGGQSYFGTDNFLSFLLPSISDYTGITFGTCFFLFRPKVKYYNRDEYLPFYKERKQKGLRN